MNVYFISIFDGIGDNGTDLYDYESYVVISTSIEKALKHLGFAGRFVRHSNKYVPGGDFWVFDGRRGKYNKVIRYWEMEVVEGRVCGGSKYIYSQLKDFLGSTRCIPNKPDNLQKPLIEKTIVYYDNGEE